MTPRITRRGFVTTGAGVGMASFAGCNRLREGLIGDTEDGWGRVTDPLGNGIPATLRAYDSAADAESPVAETSADEDGRFRFEGLSPPATTRLVITAQNADLFGLYRVRDDLHKSFELFNEFLFGPTLVENGASRVGYLTIWRTYGDQLRDQLLHFELVEVTRGEGDNEWLVDDAPGILPADAAATDEWMARNQLHDGAFSVRLPESVTVGYPTREGGERTGPDDLFGGAIPALFDVPSGSRDRLQRWHPFLTGIPVGLGAPTTMSRLTDLEERREAALEGLVSIGVGVTLSALQLDKIALLISLLRWNVENTAGPTPVRLPESDSVPAPDLNRHDIVHVAWELTSSGVMFSVPCRLPEDESVTAVVQSLWTSAGSDTVKLVKSLSLAPYDRGGGIHGTWAVERRSTANTGYVPNGDDPVEPITERWSFETRSGVGTTPLLADGVVYVGDGSGTVFAVDSSDGTERWHTDLGSTIYSTPAIDAEAGVVYVGLSESLLALDAETGTRRWQTDGMWVESDSAVVFASGAVIVAGSYRGESGVFRMSQSGEVTWSFPSADPECTPAVADGTVYTHGDAPTSDVRRELVSAVDFDTGDERWRHHVDTPPDRNTRITAISEYDGTVYVGGETYRVESGQQLRAVDGFVHALDANTGRERWRFRRPGGVRSALATDDSAVYVVVAEGDAVSEVTPEQGLYAVDADTGELRWAHPTPDNDNPGAPFVVTDTTLYFARDGVHALDTATGRERWQVAHETHSLGVPVVLVDGVLLVAGPRGVRALVGGE
jgi:outer membrane protein assembly factor BamB